MLSLENFTFCKELWQPGYTLRVRYLQLAGRPGERAYKVRRRPYRAKVQKLMKAIVNGEVIAESYNVIEGKAYQYFPPQAVRLDRLEKVAKTASDLACPHGVQFYDVIVGNKRHGRAAWSYEAPRPEMRQVGGRFGF